MATILRRTDPLCAVIRDTRNLIKKQIGAGAAFHLDACERTIAAADATTLATSLVLVAEIKAVYEFHRVDGDPGMAHKAADATNAVAAAAATDLATAITLANEIKVDYEAHRASTSFHHNADATNTIAAANATDQTSLNTLLNELKLDINAHMASAPTNVAPAIRLVDA